MRAEAGAASAYAVVVLDTDVLLSAALLPNSVPARITGWLLQHSRLAFSSATFAELETRLWKPKFDRYVSIEQRHRLLHDLQACSLWVELPDEMTAKRWSRDPSDDVFVHTAQAAGAQRLVSGDEDLLVLDSVGSLRILRPRAAVEELSLPASD